MTRNESAQLRQLAASIAQHTREAPETDPWAVVEAQGLDRIGIPEDQGGLSGTVDEACQVVTALAEHGWFGPVLEATVAQMASTRGRRQASGRRTTTTFADAATLSIADNAATGTLTSVPWVSGAEALVVVTSDQVLEFGLGHPGVTGDHDHAKSLHGTPLTSLRLDEAPFLTLGGDLWSTTTTYRFGLLSSAALLGSLRAAYAMTRDFVLTREQFGKPLARINSVGANLARMRTEILMAEVGLQRAVDAASAGELDAAGQAAVCAARVTAGNAATTVAHLSHRLHGAMGITMEYPLHRHTTRLWELRDAGLPERSWAERLGDSALRGSEADLWTVFSA